MVQPQNNLLVHSPSFGVHNVDFVTELTEYIDPELNGLLPKSQKHLPPDFIRIDNDVRCATRFKWKVSLKQENLLCVFIGNGLGSGIVLDGKMIYGTNFSAGEAGHTTISYTPELFKDDLKKCHCEQKGHHWEMYVASYGVINMMKKIDPEKFEQFKKKYCSYGEELTTYQIATAYKEKDPYTVDVIENEFIKYLAIGVSNYINILNPEKIILGGGMIRTFLSEQVRIEQIQKVISDYTLSAEGNILTDVTEKQYLASIGAALIFEDDSYSEFVEKHKN
jgi:predicted NBD/HSP70 family sugar kinase